MGEIIYALFWRQTRTAIRDKTGNVIETVEVFYTYNNELLNNNIK